ncbi:MAG: type II toxin-antitoxin system VapC family toxin [Gemmatimonadota bacterium]
MILDTHIWIWVVDGKKGQLSADAIREIEASSQRGEVLVSAISVWEVATLEVKGRISLSRPVEEWVQLALRAPGTRLVGLTPEIAIESTRLPDDPHGDPADRILMASARVMGVPLASRDERIIRYGEGGNLAVLDARP